MLTIGKLANQTDLTTNALRFYEREGLLNPTSKTASGYRLYDETALARVRFIRQAQLCGFTLVEVNELLTLRSNESSCCDDVRKLAVVKKLRLEAKIKSMRAMSKALDALIDDCPEGGAPLGNCPIIGAMEKIMRGANV